jgi:hypothetical protein
MKPVQTMAGVAVGSWIAIAAIAAGLGRPAGGEILAGMIGPLLAASVSWALAERTYTLQPERLTSLMIAAFAGKIVFFGAYVTVALKVLALRPVPFMLSFTGYFIALYLMEALYLRRLFLGPAKAGHYIR